MPGCRRTTTFGKPMPSFGTSSMSHTMCIRSLAVAFIALLSLGANVAVADLATLESLSAFQTFSDTNANGLIDDGEIRDSAGATTAVHGFLAGVEADGFGDPLLTLLNEGTSTGLTVTLNTDPASNITISDSGMFSTSTNIETNALDSSGKQIVDLIDGSPITLSANEK